MNRPTPRFRIHDTTRIWAIEHDPHLGLAWRGHDVTRKTPRALRPATEPLVA